MIQLTEKLAVTSDKYQYILGTPREVARKSGEGTTITMDNPRYFKTLAQVLRAAISHEMKRGVSTGELDTLASFAQRLEEVTTDFEAKISGFEV